MSDLTDRLRGAPHYFRVQSLRLEAADRIEELEDDKMALQASYEKALNMVSAGNKRIKELERHSELLIIKAQTEAADDLARTKELEAEAELSNKKNELLHRGVA